MNSLRKRAENWSKNQVLKNSSEPSLTLEKGAPFLGVILQKSKIAQMQALTLSRQCFQK